MRDNKNGNLFGDAPLPYEPPKRHFPDLNARESVKARDEGMARVDAKAKAVDEETEERWRAEYSREIGRFAAKGKPFLAEDVTAICGIPDGIDPRAVGPLFRAAQDAGLIEPTGRMPNGRSVSRHRTIMREWIGVAGRT